MKIQLRKQFKWINEYSVGSSVCLIIISLFFLARSVQSRNIQAVVVSEIQEFAQLRDTYALGRSIRRLEDLNLIRCVKINVVPHRGAPTVIIDDTPGSPCRTFNILGSRIRATTETPDGTQSWALDMIAITDPVYLALFPILMVLAVAAVIIGKKMRHLKEQQLVEQYEMHMRIAEDRRKLAQQVAHDIRSPLSALNILAGKLAGAPEGELIRSAVKKINAIAEDVLKQGRQISEGRSGIRKVEIASVLRDLVAQKRVEFSSRVLEMKMDGQSIECVTEETGLHRILSNLINNAFEASMPNQPVRISVGKDASSRSIRVAVIDKGEGIPENKLSKLGFLQWTSKKMEMVLDWSMRELKWKNGAANLK